MSKSREMKIISEHLKTPRRERTRWEGTAAEYTVTPVPYGKKRIMAVVGGRTVHVDVPRE